MVRIHPFPALSFTRLNCSGGGYASEAIAFVRALDDFTDVHVTIDQHGDSIDRNVLQNMPSKLSSALQRMYRRHLDPTRAISVCHSEPGAWVPPNYPTTTCPPPGSLYRVGRTMFETDRLPKGWEARLNGMDEVWVPTTFHRDVFARGGVDGAKLHVLGEPVDTNEFDPATVKPLPYSLVEGPLGQGEPTGEAVMGATASGGADLVRVTRFLSVFKWEYRKGWDVLLRAFLGEFSRSDPVVLYILTSAYHSTSDFAGELQRFQRAFLACSLLDDTPDDLLVLHGGGDGRHASAIDSGLPRPSDFCIDFGAVEMPSRSNTAPLPSTNSSVAESARRLRSAMRRLLPGHLPRFRVLRRLSQRELPRLYRSVDAFVLPSRGEGWGRPHVEAMAMALPVIATNWSGPTAYLDSSNGYPLPYTHLRAVPEGAFAGHLMAEPSERELARAMRTIVTEPGEAQARGRQAREHMVRKFSPRVFAGQLRNHVERIAIKLGNSGTSDRSQNFAPGAILSTKRQPSEADDAVAAMYDGTRNEEL